MPVKADKNVVMPAAPVTGRPAKYPWATMKIGESFELPAPSLAHVRAHCTGANERYGKKFVARRMSGGKFRVWRTE